MVQLNCVKPGLKNVDQNTIKDKIQGSPEAENVQTTTISGWPAVAYQTKNGPGVAVIKNDDLFYLSGFNSQNLLTTLKIY